MLERDIKTMCSYLKSQLKKDLQEVMDPISSSLHAIYATLEDFRVEYEMHLDALRESQQI